MSVERDRVNGFEPQEPIGAVLLKRGLLTEEQLDDALGEQRSSGKPLGAILVARGYASPALVAQALATQHGSMLKTEYGFATGFGTGALAQAATAEPPVSIHHARSSTALAVAPPPVDGGEGDREAFRSELEVASSEAARLVEANERLSALRAELELRLAHETQRTALLERELAELRSAPAPPADELASWQQSNAQLDTALQQWQAAYADVERQLAQSKEQSEKRDAELRQLESSVGELDETIASLEQARAAADQRAVTAEARCFDLEPRLEQATAHASAAEARAADADEARRQLEHRLEGIVARAEALQGEVVAAEEIRTSLEASEQARAKLEIALQEAVEGLREAAVVRADLEARLEAMTIRAGTLEAAAAVEAVQLRQFTAAATAEAEGLRRAAAVAEQERAVLEQELTELRALEQREAESTESLTTNAAGAWADATSHLVFFQGSEGYELAELDGPPPAEGTQVVLPALPMQTVTRVGRSPFRGDSLPCAYLTAT